MNRSKKNEIIPTSKMDKTLVWKDRTKVKNLLTIKLLLIMKVFIETLFKLILGNDNE